MKTYHYECDCGYVIEKPTSEGRWQLADIHLKTCNQDYKYWIEKKRELEFL